jgi:hypothetical protein
MNYALLKENRSLGWIEFPPTASDWVKRHCIEHRAAQLEKRPVDPRYLAQYAFDAEKRYRAAVAAGRVKPTTRNNKRRGLTIGEVRAIAKKTGRSFEEVLHGVPRVDIDTRNRQRAADYAKRIAYDAVNVRAAAKDDDDWDFDDPGSDEKHERMAERHRVLAGRAKTLDLALAHYKAESAHRQASKTKDPTDHIHAGALSYGLRKRK